MKTSVKHNLMIVVLVVLYFAFLRIANVKLQPLIEQLYFDPLVLMVIKLFINGLFGCVLGFMYFLNEKKRNGVWKIDKTRFFILVLPTLILVINLMLFYSTPYSIFNAKTVESLFGRLSDNDLAMSQILLGYVILTSFYKRSIGDDFI